MSQWQRRISAGLRGICKDHNVIRRSENVEIHQQKQLLLLFTHNGKRKYFPIFIRSFPILIRVVQDVRAKSSSSTEWLSFIGGVQAFNSAQDWLSI